jgi:hypothetical protein
MRSSLYGGLMLIAILTVGFVAAGCGGGDDNLTKAEFLKQGNEICKKGSQQIDKEAKKVFTSNQEPSQAEFNKFVTGTVIPSTQGQIDDIRDLNPPSDDEDQVNAILDSAQAALDKTKQDPTLLQGGKNDPFKKTNQLSKAYGLTVCGSG